MFCCIDNCQPTHLFTDHVSFKSLTWPADAVEAMLLKLSGGSGQTACATVHTSSFLLFQIWAASKKLLLKSSFSTDLTTQVSEGWGVMSLQAEVYPDRPLTVGSCRWKYLREQVCRFALPTCSRPWAWWDITAEHMSCEVTAFRQLD